MHEVIQANITQSDLAYDVKLRIDLTEQITEDDLDSIDSELSSQLMTLGIGLATAHGEGFISVSLLDFGETPTFAALRTCVKEALSSYQSLIKQITYNKSEFTQASFDFIAEKMVEFEAVLNEAKIVFSHVDFSSISTTSDSPEHRYFSGSDTEETITIFISEIKYNQKDWIRFSVGCKRLNKEELDTLLNKVNRIHPNSACIKWNGLEYNYDIEAWEPPKHEKLFEVIEN